MRQSEVQALRDHAERLIQGNLRKGRHSAAGVDYVFLCPTPRQYKSQHLWDSCFHAVAMVHVEPDLAMAELRTLLAGQDEDGFIGSVTHWGQRFFGLGQFWNMGQSRPGERVRHSGLIHPPLLALAVEHVARTANDPGFAAPLLPALDRYHNWLAENRAPDDDGLLVIVSPRESAMDDSPAHDAALGGVSVRRLGFRLWLDGYDSQRMLQAARFYVKDPAVNAVYAESLSAMARMHRAMGHAYIASAYHERAARVTESIVTKMLDRGRGAFFSLVGPSELRDAALTVGGLMPLMLEGLPRDIAGDLVERHIAERKGFWLRFPLPSVSAAEPAFDPRGARATWRGPVWVGANWLIWRGLRQHHFDDLAEMLAARTIGMVAEGGLRQCYNPLNGQGMGATDFAPSALVLDMASPR